MRKLTKEDFKVAQFVNLVGRQFGKLKVIERAPNQRKHIYYTCKCICGNLKNIRNDKLLNGQAVNCGCERKKRNDNKYDTKNSRLYHVYIAMKQRCFNTKCKAYKNYGAKGISVCKEWTGEGGFENFQKWAVENGYRYDAEWGEQTLDRINVTGNYEPANCRWLSIQAQQNNTTRNTILSCNGETHNLKEWSVIRNIKYSRILKRRKLGWTPEEILEFKRRDKNEVK